MEEAVVREVTANETYGSVDARRRASSTYAVTLDLASGGSLTLSSVSREDMLRIIGAGTVQVALTTTA